MELNSIEFWDSMKDKYLENKDSRDNVVEFPIIAQYCLGSVVEFGCAFGMFYKYLREDQKPKYLGVEISPRLYNAAHELSDAHFMIGDIRNSGLATNSFDTAIALQLLEHFEDYDFIKSLSEMKRIAKKRVIFSVPNKNTVPDKSHIQMFDYERVYTILKPYGAVTFIPCQNHHIVAVQDG